MIISRERKRREARKKEGKKERKRMLFPTEKYKKKADSYFIHTTGRN